MSGEGTGPTKIETHFPFALPKGVSPAPRPGRPNWCGKCGLKPCEGKTGRCPGCNDLDFSKRIVARRAKAEEDGDARELAAIASEIMAWRAKGRKCFA